jgi:hypothetical protein
MIYSVMKNKEPQMNADERRFVVPALSSVLVLTDAIQKNERNLTTNLYELNTNYRSSFQFVSVRCFFSGSFMNQGHKADFAGNNNANHSKSVLERPLNMFDDSLKMRQE